MKHKITFFIGLILICNIVLSQKRIEKELPKELHAEIVTIEDKSLTKIIDSLNLKESHCMRKGENWYFEHIRDDYFVLSKNRLSRLIFNLNEDESILLTLIDGVVIFIRYSKDSKLTIRNTGLKTDLSKFIRKPNVSFEDSSNWILKKVEGEYTIIREQLFSCN